MRKKSSIKIIKKKGKTIVKGKKMVMTNSECAVCSKGSDITIDGKLKKKKEKTCYSRESLERIARAYNKKNKNDPIQIENISTNKLWNIIRNKLSGICGYDEYCWKKQDFIKRLRDNDINYYTFKPKYPDEWKKNPYTWLNTYDILFVMKQYEKMRNDFIFLAVAPSDCPMEINCEMSNIDIKKMIGSGINKMGAVYNLDKSDEPGSHWVGFYCEFNKKKAEINYYDSYGELPNRSIKKFIYHLAGKFDRENIKPTIIYNDKRHQYGNNACGIFSMNFIIERLYGTSIYEISQMEILDKDMTKLRKILYTFK